MNGVYRNIMYQIEKRKLQQSYFGNYRCEIVSRINYNFYVKYLCLLPSWKRMKDLPLSLHIYSNIFFQLLTSCQNESSI